MGLFNREVKKKTTNGNGKTSGNDHGAGNGANGQASGPVPVDGDNAELFEVQTSQSLRGRIADVARNKAPHSIKELMPWLDKARSSPEGRAELVDKTKEVAWQQIDNTTRAVTAGMGLADTRAFFRGDPAIEKPNPRYKIHVNAFFAHIRPKY
jgi:hypothetical protein